MLNISLVETVTKTLVAKRSFILVLTVCNYRTCYRYSIKRQREESCGLHVTQYQLRTVPEMIDLVHTRSANLVNSYWFCANCAVVNTHTSCVFVYACLLQKLVVFGSFDRLHKLFPLHFWLLCQQESFVDKFLISKWLDGLVYLFIKIFLCFCCFIRYPQA